jgi:hypothetical protein
MGGFSGWREGEVVVIRLILSFDQKSEKLNTRLPVKKILKILSSYKSWFRQAFALSGILRKRTSPSSHDPVGYY